MKHFFIAIIIFIAFSSFNSVNIVKKIGEPVNKTDSIIVKKIFNSALTNGGGYEWLRDLTSNIGGRLSGSPEAQQAVEWGEKLMTELEFDKVWLQPVMVPHWVRGEKEEAYFTINQNKYNPNTITKRRCLICKTVPAA